MQADAVHELVHYERCSGHIARILHQGDEKVEDQDVGEEHEYASHSGDDAVHHQVLEPSFMHERSDSVPEPAHKGVYPFHRIVPEGECGVEHKVKEDHENGESRPFVGHHGVYPVGEAAFCPVRLFTGICLGESPLDEGVFGIHDGGFGIISQQSSQPLLLFAACGGNLPAAVERPDNALHILVVFQIFYCKPARRESASDIRIPPLDDGLEPSDALLKLGSMIYMDMPQQAFVLLLINPDYGVEKRVDSLSAPAHGRTDGHPQEMGKLPDVKAVAPCFEFVIHVQGHHYPKVHVYELGCEVEIPLEIRGVNHVQHDVRSGFQQILAHIKLFRAICREGICAGKVHENEVVAGVAETSFLGVHCHPAVVAHMLMAARGDVEKGSLAAVGIADKGHPYFVLPFVCEFRHLPVQEGLFFIVAGIQDFRRMLGGYMLLDFIFAQDLYALRLFPPERHPVSEHFIFDRVLQWGVEDDPHLLAAYESHLDQAFTKTPVPRNPYYRRALSCFQLR